MATRILRVGNIESDRLYCPEPNMLPKEAVQEFIEIYRKNTGKDLEEKEAVIIAQRFFEGMKILFDVEIDEGKN